MPIATPVTRTGWDMDPFVVVSFGKKVFRTRVIRHSRNPIWDEKLLFHVRRYETSFKVNLAILDWDKLSSNDYVGDVSFDVKELVECTPQPDVGTGLYPVDEGGEGPMVDYRLPLVGNASWEGKYSPVLSFRCVSFTPSTWYILLTYTVQSEIPTLRCPPTTVLASISETIRY
jgi:phosphatidylserine decarboxylase